MLLYITVCIYISNRTAARRLADEFAIRPVRLPRVAISEELTQADS